MENYGKATDLTTEALNSQGSAMEKYAVYQESIAASQGRIKALTETFISNLDLEGLIHELLTITEVVLKLFSTETSAKITKFVVAFGMFLPLVKGLVGAFKLAGGMNVANLLWGAGAGLAATPVIGQIMAIVAAVLLVISVLDKLIVTQKELNVELIRQQQEIENTTDELKKYEEQLLQNNARITEINLLKERGKASIVDIDEAQRLKEENRQLERNIVLSREKLRISEAEAKKTASDLYKKSGVNLYNPKTRMGDQQRDYDASSAIEYYKKQKEEALKYQEIYLESLNSGLNSSGNKLTQSQLATVQKRYDAFSAEVDKWDKKLIEQVELGETLLPNLVGAQEASMLEALKTYYNGVMTLQEKVTSAFEEDPALLKESEALEKLASVTQITAKDIERDFTGVLSVFEKFGLKVEDVVIYFNNLANSAREASTQSSKSYFTIYSEVENKINAISSAQKELKSSGQVSIKTISNLGKEFGNLDGYLTKTSDGYTLTKESLDRLLESQDRIYTEAITNAKVAASEFISAETDKQVSVNATSEAMKQQLRAFIAMNSSLDISKDASGKTVYGEKTDAQLASTRKAIAALAALESAERDYDKYSDIKNKISTYEKPSNKSSDKTKKESAYEKDIRNMEHRLYLSEQIGESYKNDETKYTEYAREVSKQSELLLELQNRVATEAKILRKKGFTDESEDIQNLQKAWWEYHAQRKELENSLAETKKKNAEAERKRVEDENKRVEDSLSKIKSAIGSLLADEKEKLDKITDTYDYQISKIEALKKLTEDYYSITNSVSAELASMAGSDDYKALATKLKNIADSSGILYEQYLSEINSLTEDEIYKADSITDEFERQYNYKKKEFEVAQKELELAKAQTELQNIMANRNIRMYKDGQWSWVADHSAVAEAQKAVDEAEYEVKSAKISLQQQSILDGYNKMISTIKLQSDAAKAEYDLLSEEWRGIERQLTTQADSMTILLEAINGNDIPAFQKIIGSVGEALNSLISRLSGGSVQSDIFGSGGSSGGGGGSGGSFTGNQGLEDLLGSSDANRYLQNKVDYGNAMASGNKQKADALNKENIALRDKYSVGADTITTKQAAEALGYDDGGILNGMGGIKATTQREVVFNGKTSAKLLSPEKSKEFLNSSKALNSFLDNPSAFSDIISKLSKIVSGNSSSDSHDLYINGDLSGKITKEDSNTISSIMRRYIPLT